MKRTKLLTAAMLILLACPGFALASFEKAWSVRGEGLGRSGLALFSDINALFINPASIVALEDLQGYMQYRSEFPGLDNDSLKHSRIAYSQSFGEPGAMGAYLDYFHSALYRELSLSVSLARPFKILIPLEAGFAAVYLNKKFISNKYTVSDPLFAGTGYSKSGGTINAGLRYKALGKLMAALVLDNIISTDISLAKNKSDVPPFTIAAGLSYLPAPSFSHSLDVSYIAAASYGSRKYNIKFGVEKWFELPYYISAAAVRAGINLDQAACGFGFRFKQSGIKGEINYSFSYPLNGLFATFGTHNISLQSGF